MNTSSSITTDLFLGGKLKIRQNEKGYKSGSDAVLLAAFIKKTKGKILEVGCGSGAASLCLGHRLKGVDITGIDIQPSLVKLALQNAKENNLSSHFTFLTQDIKQSTLPNQSFDHVFSNPPYFEGSSPSPSQEKALSKSQVFPLSEWVDFCIRMTKPRGYISFIYPTAHLNDLLQNLKGMGDIHLFPLWPKENKDSKRILISARKGVKCGLTLEPGLILHTEEGKYTEKADAVLRGGQEL